MIQKLWVFVLALAITGAFAVKEVRQNWATPLQVPNEGFILQVARGDSLRSVANTLHTAGVLAHPNLVILFGRWTGADQHIKRGEYRLPPNSTAESMLKQLQKGDVIKYQVTLPEGITLQKAIDILSQQEQLKKTLTGPDDPRLFELVKPYTKPEGLFFPDSYRYVRGDSDWSILQRAHATMTSVLQEEWPQRTNALPFSTPYEALIMASIIERETGISEERAQISGVFARRLQKGMLLQTDPAVIYGLGNEFDGNLQRRHLEEESNAYNTYKIPGLPPTPIALPGRDAIHAALHPDTGDSLYFVARGDGGHVFAETLTQHNRAVREYQLQRSENYRSTPEKSQ